ncbi:MAG TPA: hypothetical protein VF808_16110 [Ktedonobacterales bacterium]
MSRRALVITALVTVVFLAPSAGMTSTRAWNGRANITRQPTRVPVQAVVASTTITGRAWKLAAFTYNGEPQTLAPGAVVTLRFLPDVHTLGGRAGC